MFRGITSVNMDAKGRLALPVRYRDALVTRCAGRVVLTVDPRERCLLLYPQPDWETLQRKLEALPNIKSTPRLLQRMLIGHAMDVDLDGSGRLLVPPMLREFADLTKKLVLAGQGNKIEVWSHKSWDERMKEWRSPETVSALDVSDGFDELSI